MRTKQGPTPTQYFWDIADTFLEREDVSEGKLMGFPCLHVSGEFLSTCDHRSGDLIVKLPKARVTELIDSGAGEAFAPAGRTFKEWVLTKRRSKNAWVESMDESLEFVAQKNE